MSRFFFQILGLENCADTMVGDAIRRGISGGEKRRLTTGSVCLRIDLLICVIWLAECSAINLERPGIGLNRTE